MRLGKSFSVAFSPDGEWLAALSQRSVRILSSSTGSVHLAIKARHPSVVRFSPNSKTLLLKTTSGRISLHGLDGSDAKLIRPDQGEGPAPEFANDSTLVNAGWNGSLEIIDLACPNATNIRAFDGEMIEAIHRFPAARGWLVHHSPKATTDNLPPDPCYFTRWSGEVPYGSPSYLRPELRFIRGSALHPSGATLAVVSGAPPNHLALIDIGSSTTVAKQSIESGGTGSRLAWSPDGQRLAVVEQHAVRLYDQRLALLQEVPLQYASSIAFAPRANVLAIGSWEDGCTLDLS